MKTARMSALVFFIVVVALPCSSQDTKTGMAKTSGACSPAVTGNRNQLTINCQGLSKDQGAKMVKVLNKILANQLDPKLVMEKLDEILHQTVDATQPLTTLSLEWKFVSKSPSLWQIMKIGQDDVDENARSTQGDVPLVPYEIEDYNATLLPVLSYVARIGDPPADDQAPTAGGAEKANSPSVIVLIPLDDSRNAILSFGSIGNGASWTGDAKGATLSSGFEPGGAPGVEGNLAKDKPGGSSTYAIRWGVSPLALASAVNRANPAIPSTAKLPKMLKITMLYGTGSLPFNPGDFANSYATNLWGKNEGARRYINPGPELMNAKLNVAVNGSEGKTNGYVLKTMYELRLVDQFDDDFNGITCKVFEFEAI